MYLVIKDRLAKQIDEKQKDKLLQDGIYYTFGKDGENQDIFIFDYDKQKVSKMVEDLQKSYVAPKLSLGYWLIFGVVGLVGYFIFFTGGDDEVKNTPTIETSQAQDLLFDRIEEETQIVTSGNITPDVPVIDNTKQLELQINNLKNSLLESDSRYLVLTEQCNGEKQLLRSEIGFLNSRIVPPVIDTSVLDNTRLDLEVCVSEKANLKSKLDSLNLELRSENQLFLNVGRDVLNKCKEQKNAFCNDYIYNFIGNE